ncbi:hypothetical protein DPMN_045449 [Dreissena polymorpha]|uniref:TM2 domain-containing protein n=2 Tax=Dreissena polymorpha TaxID=45954 RepID=A0A9D4HZQ8_DREPO|nr:hypothetical protein DPMN_045446 [Dreissena polymorpha]KAH3738806.1 hypothetical protein DPMN_045449 [Dreissena polymorpha]
MSKEHEAFQQRTQDGGIPVYNTAMPGTCVMPGPVLNPMYHGGPGTSQGSNCHRKKSYLEAYMLWLLLGLLGAHHFYLRRPGFGVLYFFTFGLGGCGWLFDMFRLPYLVNKTNKELQENIPRNEKNISDAYTLWFPFGLLGFHHFYLNKPGFGVLYLFTFGLFGIGWLVDLFLIPYHVRKANDASPTNKEKQVGTAYALGVSPIGLLGAHQFYLNRPEYGLLYFFTFGNFGIGWIVDWFRLPVLVKRANKHMALGNDGTRYLDDAYILWFPLGILGAHHFYLNRPLWGILYFFTFGLFGIGWLVDGCRMPCLVKDTNKLKEERRRLPTQANGFGYGYQGAIISTTGMTTGAVGYGAPVIYPTLPVAPYPQQQLYPTQHAYQPAGPYGPHTIGQNGPQQNGYQQPPAYAATNNAPSYMGQPPPYVPSVAIPDNKQTM